MNICININKLYNKMNISKDDQVDISKNDDQILLNALTIKNWCPHKKIKDNRYDEEIIRYINNTNNNINFVRTFFCSIIKRSKSFIDLLFESKRCILIKKLLTKRNDWIIENIKLENNGHFCDCITCCESELRDTYCFTPECLEEIINLII